MEEYPKRLIDFVFNSPLSLERQQDIIDFVASLTEDHKQMISEIIGEVELEIAFDNSGEEQ